MSCDSKTLKSIKAQWMKSPSEKEKLIQQCDMAALHAYLLPIVKDYPSLEQYNTKLAYQIRKQTELLNTIVNTINSIKPFLPYCRNEVYNEIYNQLLVYKNYPPVLLLNVDKIMMPENNPIQKTSSRRRWGRRSRRWWHEDYWTEKLLTYRFTENAVFDNKIEEFKNYCDVIIPQLIVNETQNNCDNTNTLLDKIGLQACGINDTITTFRNKIQIYKSYSNRVMDKIQNTPQFPQYALAKKTNDVINNLYNWYPLDERSTINNGFAKLTKQQIKDTLNLFENKAMTLYNNVCVSNDFHIGLDADNIPLCVTEDYKKTAQRCGQAIQMSKVYEYGTDKLTNLWTDVSNSIPGNLKGPSMGILDSTNNSCKKWVDMFNIWQEEEEKAMSEPCAPERPILSTNDPTMIKMADEWNKSASDHIAQLKARLMRINKYIKNYPNILHLNKNDVILAPYSMSATANIKIKYDSSESGESPNHYLEMIIPNGEHGKKGDTGYQGIIGHYGYQGANGDEGPMGQMSK